jgi:DNA-binding transcriptional LysR family regulator
MIRLLECALALDRHRNFARAAEQLGVSQPTLTRSIQELERQFGARLFDRSRRGLEPTPFGAIVLASGRRVALDIAEVKREIALLKGLNAGELTVGVGPLVSQTFLGAAVGSLLAKHPMLSLRILDLDWWEIPEALHQRRIDLAIGEIQEASEDPDLAIEPFPHRRVCFFSRTAHPLQRLKRVTIKDIAEFPFIGPRLPRRASDYLPNGGAMGHLAEGGQYFAPRIQCQNFYAISLAVGASDAVGLATQAKLKPMLAGGRIAIIPFHPAWLRTNYAVIHLRQRTLSPAAVAFCEETREAERQYNEGGPAKKKGPRR